MSKKFEVVSELPGVFYRRPSPQEPEFARLGDRIESGQTVGLIEIMKQFSEIKSSVGGTVVEFPIEDGQMVTPGAVVAVIESE